MNALKPDLLPFLSSLIVTLSDLPVFVNHITKHQPIKVTQSSSSSSFIHLISCGSLLIKLLPHCHFCVIAVFYFHCQYPKRASLFLVQTAKRWETMETVTDFIFGVSKITADGNCSHEINRCLLLGRKAVTNVDNILKSKDITLPTKVHLVKAIVFQQSCMDVRAGP